MFFKTCIGGFVHYPAEAGNRRAGLCQRDAVTCLQAQSCGLSFMTMFYPNIVLSGPSYDDYFFTVLFTHPWMPFFMTILAKGNSVGFLES